MHAVLGGLHYQGPEGTPDIETLDAPVVAADERQAQYYSRDLPDLAKGFHVSLFNNVWGKNYVHWFGDNMRFRFKLRA